MWFHPPYLPRQIPKMWQEPNPDFRLVLDAPAVRPIPATSPDKRAFISILWGNKARYLRSICFMCHSVREVDKLTPVIVMISADVNNESRRYLKDCGLTVQPVYDISKHMNSTFLAKLKNDTLPPYSGTVDKQMFQKIHAWDMTQYEKVIYIDADVIVTEPTMIDLFRCPTDFCATLDPLIARPGSTQVNGGMFVLKPNRTVYLDLIRNLNHFPDDVNLLFAEQAYLTWYFRERQASKDITFTPLDPSFNYGAPSDLHPDIKNISAYHFMGGTQWCYECQLMIFPYDKVARDKATDLIRQAYSKLSKCGLYWENEVDCAATEGCSWCGFDPLRCVESDLKEELCTTSVTGWTPWIFGMLLFIVVTL